VRRTAYRRRAEFGLYVDRHGNPPESRTVAVVEWEGTAERAAHHPPYVLLFDSRFIEVRNAETGRLAQIILGDQIRCIWDGPVMTRWEPVRDDEDPHQEPRVHAVMSNSTMRAYHYQEAGVIAQHILELIPTVPLDRMSEKW
jgi:hypothetical protein